jgi:hypothetical protein
MMIPQIFTQRYFFKSYRFQLTTDLFQLRELRELTSCRAPDKIRLGPRPGERVRSVVSAPKKADGGFGDGRMMSHDPDEEDDLDIFTRTLEGHPSSSMVDLDESSDDGLEVEPLGAS